MTDPRARDIVYDWNDIDKLAPITTKDVEFLDETLRDGIQSPSAVDPPVEDKLKLLHLMNDLGINWPGAALALDLLERLEQLDRI